MGRRPPVGGLPQLLRCVDRRIRRRPLRRRAVVGGRGAVPHHGRGALPRRVPRRPCRPARLRPRIPAGLEQREEHGAVGLLLLGPAGGRRRRPRPHPGRHVGGGRRHRVSHRGERLPCQPAERGLRLGLQRRGRQLRRADGGGQRDATRPPLRAGGARRPALPARAEHARPLLRDPHRHALAPASFD